MAFFQEQRPVREPFLRAPASVVVLIGVLVLAHAGRVLAPPGVSDWMLQNLALDPVVYSAAAMHKLGVPQPGLLWLIAPLFGHLFIHANLTHLAINSAWLLAFGPIVARRFGAWAFLAFFLLCGLAGAALFIALDWGSIVIAIGASGAISGLMGAAFRMMRIREPWLNTATLPLEPLFSRQILLISAIWLAVNLLTGLIGIGVSGSFESIAWQAHMGGYLAGLLLVGPFDDFFGPWRRLRSRGP